MGEWLRVNAGKDLTVSLSLTHQIVDSKVFLPGYEVTEDEVLIQLVSGDEKVTLGKQQVLHAKRVTENCYSVLYDDVEVALYVA